MNSSNVPLELHSFPKAFPQMSQVYVFSQMNSDHMMPQVHFLYPFSSAKLDAFSLSVCIKRPIIFCAFFTFLHFFTFLQFTKLIFKSTENVLEHTYMRHA